MFSTSVKYDSAHNLPFSSVLYKLQPQAVDKFSVTCSIFDAVEVKHQFALIWI